MGDDADKPITRYRFKAVVYDSGYQTYFEDYEISEYRKIFSEISQSALKFTNENFEKYDAYFRGFLKELEVTGLGSELEPGTKSDLRTFLFILSNIVEDCEEPEIVKKYKKDIYNICYHQLDGGDDEHIFEEIQIQAYTI